LKTYLKYNNITVECFPKNALKLSYKKNADEVFLRRELTESLIFINNEVNNCFDYDKIKTQSIDTEFTFSIPDNNYTAIFYITDCEIDEYKQTITVKPKTYDEYTPIDNLIQDSVNVAKAYSVGTQITPIKSLSIGFLTIEFKIHLTYTGNFRPPTQEQIEPDLHYLGWNYPGDLGFNSNMKVVRLQRLTAEYGYFNQAYQYWEVWFYYRYEQHLSSVAPDSYWQFRSFTVTNDEIQISKWIRPYGGNIIPEYTIKHWTGNAWNQSNEHYTYTLIYEPNPKEYHVTIKSYPFLDFIKTFLLLDRIDIESDFFNSEQNPIATMLGLVFSFKNLYISIKSNFAFEASGVTNFDLATKCNISLKEMFDYLYTQFKVRWDMHNNKLRFEHEYFYENGFSYNNSIKTFKDISSYNNNYIYSYKSNELYKYITLDSGDGSYKPEFKKHKLKYIYNHEYNTTTKTTNDLTLNMFSNDIVSAIYNWEKFRKSEGFILLHCNSDNEIIYGYSNYDNTITPNNYLTVYNTLKYFYSILGLVYSATILYDDGTIQSTTDIIFKKLKRIKIRKNININSSDFRTDYTYITPMGQGVVEEAEEDLDNGTVNLTLLYD